MNARHCLLLLAVIAAGCRGASNTRSLEVDNTPPYGAYMLDEKGQVTAHSNEGTWPVSATTDADGLDTLGGQPLANIGFTLPDGTFLGLHSPSDVTGESWIIAKGEGAEAISINLGKIGVSKSEPIRALNERIPALAEAVTRAMVTTGEIEATRAAAVRDVIVEALKAAAPLIGGL